MNEVANGKLPSPDAALRSARLTGTEPDFWLNLQLAVDLLDALQSDKAEELDEIVPAYAA